MLTIFQSPLYSQENKDGPTENHHCFFQEKPISVGLGSSFNFNINAIGLNSRIYYNLSKELCIGPEFSFFNNGEDKVYDFNFVGHYIFEAKIVGIFPLLGINYTIEEDGHSEHRALGMVMRADVHRNFNHLTIFSEYSHVQSELKDDLVTLGFLLNF